MAAIGQELGADRVLFGRVESRTGGFTVSLKLLDVGTQTMERTLQDVIPAAETRGDTLERWARSFYDRLTGAPSEAVLVVRANVNRGTVYVDGQVKGTLRAGSATIEGLDDGEHAVSVESAGHTRWEASVTLEAGGTEEIVVEMVPSSRTPGGDDIDEGRPGGTSRALFWTSLVVTGAAVTGFTITGLQVRGYEDDKQAQFELLAMDDSVDLSSEPRDGNGDFVDVCQIGDNNPQSAAGRELADVCDKGRGRAKLANIFLGTSVAAVVAATYFYYAGYIKPGDSERRDTGRPSVKITPTVSPGLVGAGLAIEF